MANKMNLLKILNAVSNVVISIIVILAASKYAYIIENVEILPIKTINITFFYYIGMAYFVVVAHSLKYMYQKEIGTLNNQNKLELNKEDALANALLKAYSKHRNISFLFILLLLICQFF